MGRMWIIVVAVALCLLAAAWAILFPPAVRFTAAVQARIKKGMTLAEVERIVSKPEGDYSQWPHQSIRMIGPSNSMRLGTVLEWEDDAGWLLFVTDDSGSILEVEFTPKGASRLGILESAQWRWNRWLERMGWRSP